MQLRVSDHLETILDLHKNGFSQQRIADRLAFIGVRCARSTIGKIIRDAQRNGIVAVRAVSKSQNETKKPSVEPQNEALVQNMEFQKNKEYQFARITRGKREINEGNRTFVFLEKVGGNARKYPLFLFKNIAFNLRETFTPQQLGDFAISELSKTSNKAGKRR